MYRSKEERVEQEKEAGGKATKSNWSRRGGATNGQGRRGDFGPHNYSYWLGGQGGGRTWSISQGKLGEIKPIPPALLWMQALPLGSWKREHTLQCHFGEFSVNKQEETTEGGNLVLGPAEGIYKSWEVEIQGQQDDIGHRS